MKGLYADVLGAKAPVAFCHEIDHLDGKLFLERLGMLKRDLIKRKIRKKIRQGDW